MQGGLLCMVLSCATWLIVHGGPLCMVLRSIGRDAQLGAVLRWVQAPLCAVLNWVWCSIGRGVLLAAVLCWMRCCVGPSAPLCAVIHWAWRSIGCSESIFLILCHSFYAGNGKKLTVHIYNNFDLCEIINYLLYF